MQYDQIRDTLPEPRKTTSASLAGPEEPYLSSFISRHRAHNGDLEATTLRLENIVERFTGAFPVPGQPAGNLDIQADNGIVDMLNNQNDEYEYWLSRLDNVVSRLTRYI